jgi:hypothetical protein
MHVYIYEWHENSKLSLLDFHLSAKIIYNIKAELGLAATFSID